MSSAAGTEYWCHRCCRRVTPSSSGGEDVRCSICSDGFLEELGSRPLGGGNFDRGGPLVPMPIDPFMHTDVFGTGDGGGRGGGSHTEGYRRFMPSGQRSRGEFHGHGQQQPAILQVLDAMSSVLQHIQNNPNQQGPGMEGGGPDGEGGRGGGGVGIGDGGRGRMMSLDGGGGQMNPILLFQGMAPNFLGGAGGNVEVFFDSGNGTPRRLPANIGDYFLGPGMDQLIQQLAENDPNRYGAPPASKSAVERMPTIEIQEEHMGTDAAQCAVCKDEFELGSRVRQMPCKHLYHPDCILPWLAQHNSCPVCRYEMETDDQDYDRNRASRTPLSAPLTIQSPVTSEGGASGGGAFTMWGGQGGYGGRYGGEAATGRDASGVTSSGGTTVTSSGSATPAPQAPPSNAGATSSGRRMSLFPAISSWLRFPNTSSSSTPSAGGGQAETSSQGGGNRSSSSGSAGSGRRGQSSSRTDEDGGSHVPEPREEDLD